MEYGLLMRKKLAYSTKKSKIRVCVTRSNCVETPFGRAYLVSGEGMNPICRDIKHKDSSEKAGNKKAQEKIKENRETQSGGGFDDHGCGGGSDPRAGECGGDG